MGYLSYSPENQSAFDSADTPLQNLPIAFSELIQAGGSDSL